MRADSPSDTTVRCPRRDGPAVTDVVLPGPRDVRGTLDGTTDLDACVVAFPPHPQHGGSRSDRRLRAVGEWLIERDVACLRFDYGPWDGGDGERRDAERALAWAAERFDRVGLFGYSFGAGVALGVAAAAAESDGPPAPDATSVLAPPADAADAVADCPGPLQVVYGERDETVDAVPVADRARECGFAVEAVPADHFFVGQGDRVAALVGAFLVEALA